MKRVPVLAAALALAGCPPPAAPPQPPPPPEKPETRPPSSEEPGKVLDATISLIGGERLDLASLRGKAVILELSASDRDGWADAHAHYRKLLEQNGADALAVVLVSVDADRPDWTPDAPPFALGWDPQGALAAKLQVATLPTVFVLDAHSRIVEILSGGDQASVANLDTALKKALQSAAGP